MRSLQLDQVSAQQWVSEVQRLVSSIACDDYDGFSLFIRTVAAPLLKTMTPQNSAFVYPMLVSFVQHAGSALTRSWASVIASRGPDSYTCDEDSDDDDTDAEINDDSERRILSGNVAALLNSIVRNSLATGNASANEALLQCACNGLFWYDSRPQHQRSPVLPCDPSPQRHQHPSAFRDLPEDCHPRPAAWLCSVSTSVLARSQPRQNHIVPLPDPHVGLSCGVQGVFGFISMCLFRRCH